MPSSLYCNPAPSKQKSFFLSYQSTPISAVNGCSPSGFTAHLHTQYIAQRGMHAWALRSQYREPVRRQALSIRCRTQAHPRARIQSGEHQVFGSTCSYPAGACPDLTSSYLLAVFSITETGSDHLFRVVTRLSRASQTASSGHCPAGNLCLTNECAPPASAFASS